MAPIYHLELRRFPKASKRFNLSGQEVGAIVIPWVQERVIEIDDVKWAPYESTITIIEGPGIPPESLSMGRGWKIALREGTDVTERVLGEARSSLGGRGGEAIAQAADPGRGSDPSERGDAGAEILAALLGPDAERLLAAWRGVADSTGGLAPSESLALAEREILGRDGPAGAKRR